MNFRYGPTISYWAPPALLCGLIFWQSAHPVPAMGPDLPHVDKIVHFGIYAVLGALFLRALRANRSGRGHRACLGWSMLLSCLFGLGDEIHQYFVPWRSADVLDFVADVAGSVCGVLLLHRFMRKQPGKDSPIDKSGALG